ncbi:hypothetical protein CK203_056698 [Vitis vinifera]|uniref:Uncharacterized protein n=1 Tax=Vitis vinifera TaxID=29760 RepID=A0A438GDV6_VITVI|nr:hypothetical protein CK203_056698 [Vitis vinifera]
MTLSFTYFGKLKSRWVGPFVIHQVHSHGVIELLNSNSAKTFKVNGHRLKPFIEPFKKDKEEINLLEHRKPNQKRVRWAWRNCKENEGRSQGAKRSSKPKISMVCEISQPKIGPCKKAICCEIISSPYMASAKSRFGCENGPPLRNKFRSPTPSSAKIFAAAKPPLALVCHFAAHCETPLWHSCAISQHSNPISQLRNGLRNGLRKGPSSAKMPFLCEIRPRLRNLIPEKTQKQSNLPSSPSRLNLGRAHLRSSPPAHHGKNPRAKSSSPSSRTRVSSKTPVQGSTSEPPRPPRVPPLVEGAPMSPPVRRYHTRASSQPPKKKAKVSEPTLIDLSEPEEPATEPQPSPPSRPASGSRPSRPSRHLSRLSQL